MHTEKKTRLNAPALSQKRDAAPGMVEAPGAAHRGAIEKTPEGAEEAGSGNLCTSGGGMFGRCRFRRVVFRLSRLSPTQQLFTGDSADAKALDLLRVVRFPGPFGAGEAALTFPAAKRLISQAERFCHRCETDVPDGVFEG